ncbi:hypothetical protein L1785_01930 [Antribacter sp. KLBMP9083]|uniref:Uncharacterized protein n=1 Tax=Antribacter soli TaxID=2910976 RepID=A0AA41U5U7_9MICO|nr:hypothetical protein [Antribacter soli]MCF4119731.1 hypothetical protein [Antribacter soli]
MASKHYLVGNSVRLVEVDVSEFVEDGAEVLRIVLPGDDTHYIDTAPHDGALVWSVSDTNGTLKLELSGYPVRVYGSWLFYDQVAFRKPSGRGVALG